MAQSIQMALLADRLKGQTVTRYGRPVRHTDMAALKARLERKLPPPGRLAQAQVIIDGSGNVQVGGNLVTTSAPTSLRRFPGTTAVWSDVGDEAAVCEAFGHQWRFTTQDEPSGTRSCQRCGFRQPMEEVYVTPTPKAEFALERAEKLPSPADYQAEQERQLNEELGIRDHKDVDALAVRPAPGASIWTLMWYLLALWWAKFRGRT